MPQTPSCAVVRRWIERHFEGAPGPERELRAHLPQCSSCREYYDRRLLVEQLDPAALGPERRLAMALGFAPRRKQRLVHVWAPVPLVPRLLAALAPRRLALLAAAALLMLVLLPRVRSPSEFHARGGAALEPARSELWVYRFVPSGGAEPVRGDVRRSDELAFAYRGSAEARFLLVFGRDEHGHIYWYYPEWTDAALDPAAIPISTDPARHELPNAIAHELDGSELEICGVFSRSALHVREIEGRLEHATAHALERLEGTRVDCRTLRISP